MSKQAEFAVILKMNPMFADLGTDELQRISSLCHTQQLGVGEMLFQKGDSGDALFGVRRGQIRIETGASDGSRLTLNFMGPGDLFGEVAVLDGQSRTADADRRRADRIVRAAARGFSRPSRTRAEGRDQDHPAVVPADPLAERADGGIGAAAAAGAAGATAVRAGVRFRFRSAHLAGAIRRVRRRRPRKRQSPASALAQGRHSGSAARPDPAAEHDQADRGGAERRRFRTRFLNANRYPLRSKRYREVAIS